VASAQLLLAASAAIQEEARGVLKERAGMVRVVPFGIEMPRRVEGGYSSRGEGRVPVVGAAGTWEPGDGVGTLLEATARLVESGKDLELLLAGEGPDENRHRDRAEELGIVERVTFTREPSLADPFWDVISIYCQPSTRQTTGRYLAAALCAGLPCLASRVKDLDRLLQGGRFGGLLPAGDAEALADAIGGAILEPGQLAGRAAEGSAWARHEFDPEDSFAILKDAYEEALDPSRTPWPAGRGGGLESGDLRAD
jgi:glycosyltransferase involved in cell wall biosynthesis